MNIGPDDIVNYLNSEWGYLNTCHMGQEVSISGVSEVTSAKSSDLTYATKYTKDTELEASNAGIIICKPSRRNVFENTAITCQDPKAAFVLIYNHFFKENRSETIIHPTAIVSSEADIGHKTVIGPFVYIGSNVEIGNECWIQPNTVIGTDGFGFARDDSGKLHRQAHIAGIKIGDRVELGANNCVDSGVFKTTKIGDGTKTDNFVHIPHNATVGKDVMLTVGCMLSGHSVVEDHSYVHPQVTVGNWVTVGKGAEIGSHSTVLDDIPPYSKAVGSPARVVGESRYATDDNN